MRRLPDSPRISRRLRFPILFFLGIDIALVGLVLVIVFTPLHPVYNDPGAPVWNPGPQQVGSIVLPAPVQTPRYTPPRATVAASQAPAVPRPTPASHRPSPSRTADPSPVVSTATAEPPSSSSANPTPTDTESPQS